MTANWCLLTQIKSEKKLLPFPNILNNQAATIKSSLQDPLKAFLYKMYVIALKAGTTITFYNNWNYYYTTSLPRINLLT